MKNEVNVCKTGDTEEENRKQDTQEYLKKKSFPEIQEDLNLETEGGYHVPGKI